MLNEATYYHYHAILVGAGMITHFLDLQAGEEE